MSTLSCIIIYMETVPFYTLLFIHLVSLIIGFGSVLVIDFAGLLLIIKKIKLGFLLQLAYITQQLIWLGWSGLVLSGLGLIYYKGYIDNLTVIKLFFVAMLGVNGIVLHYIKKALTGFKEDAPIPRLYIFRMGVASIISQIGWWGAIFIGFIHRHIQHNIPWPESPAPFIAGFVVVSALVVFLGEMLLGERKKQ